MKRFTLLLAASAAAIAALPAQAQDTSLEPTYETVNLEAGFPNDPYMVELQSGGSIDASTINDACTGFIADAPDVRLNYTAGSFPLTITAISDTDTTLIINGPDGQWYCDDDSGGELDPALLFASPLGGQYDIWVGTYADSNLNGATLFITEQTRE